MYNRSVKDVADDIRGFTEFYVDVDRRRNSENVASMTPNPRIPRLQGRFSGLLHLAFSQGNLRMISGYLGSFVVELDRHVLERGSTHLVYDILADLVRTNGFRFDENRISKGQMERCLANVDAEGAADCIRNALSK